MNRVIDRNAVHQHEVLVGRASAHVNRCWRFGRELHLWRCTENPERIRLVEQRRFLQRLVSCGPRPGLGKDSGASDQIRSGKDSHVFQFNGGWCKRNIQLKGLLPDHYACYQRRVLRSREPQGMTSDSQPRERILPE